MPGPVENAEALAHLIRAFLVFVGVLVLAVGLAFVLSFLEL